MQESLSKQVATGRGKVVKRGIARLYGEMEQDVDGNRLTVPKLGEQVVSGIVKRRERISPEELERVYRMDELIFGIINKYVTVILGTGYVINAKSSKDRIAMTEWCRSVKLDSILREVIRDLFVFGFSFVEKVYNRGNDKVVRLATIDTKTMDFERDANGNIKVDKWGLPIGFEQSLWVWKDADSGAIGPGKSDIPIPRDRIAFFRLFTTSGAVIGISPLEPLYNIVTWRKNVDWAMGEGAFTYAAPPIIVNVGDKDLPVPQEMIDGISKDITEIGAQSVFTFPWHVKVMRLESSRGMEELTGFADYFKVAICNALMIPPALMGVGSSISSSRAIANLAEEWERTVQGLQTIIAEQIEEQIFYPVSKQLGLAEVPSIDWKTVSPSVALSRARRRATYARGELLTWDLNAENQIRAEEGLPILPDDFKRPDDPGSIEGKIKKMIDDVVSDKSPDEEEDEDDGKKKT